MSGGAAVQTATTGFTRMFPGRPEEISRVRGEVTRYVSGHSAADDIVLIVSELAANAALHSRSKGDFYTVSVELHPRYVYIEVEDAGGDWHLQPPDPVHPHGLQLVEAFAGAENWGVEGDSAGRVVWARLELPQ